MQQPTEKPLKDWLFVYLFIYSSAHFLLLSPPGMTFPQPSLMHPSREPVKMFRQSFERCQPLLCWGIPARTDMARLCSLTYLGRWWSSTRREWEPSWTFWWGSHPCWAYTLEHQEEGEWNKVHVYDCILLKTRGVACTQSRAHKNRRLVTPIVQSKLLNCTKNRTAGHVLINNGFCLRSMCYYF